ncbi:TetR/AcrR family transcriptional regulator [Amycolatopsis sp. NPDC001319]|uniref:TetR/AcrR family transcriptional regulator n=1 Tax=unclassified Amycolatopsis TaxID=2618356 RepID=UPI0036B64261
MGSFNPHPGSAGLDADGGPRHASPPSGRRERLRLQAIDEILDAALDVVTEQGAAALNLSEVARRVGLRQSSLYQYFDSRLAVYNALFERGMEQHLDVVRTAVAAVPEGWAALRAIAAATVRFSVDHPALSQLLFLPAVPGFEPSARAYRPSLAVQELTTRAFAAAVDRHELHPAAASERGVGLFIALGAGVGSLQLGNDQHAGFDEGRYARLVEPALDMFAAYFSPDKPAGWVP